MPKTRQLRHQGFDAIELIDDGIRMVVVHGVGPRIAWFGRGDQNLLFWDADGAHRRGGWSLRGGHRLWVTRTGADESEEAYAPDDEPCRVRSLSDGIAVTSPPDAARLEKTIVIRVRDGAWTIEHRIRNVGEMLWAGGVWALTCTLPGRATRYRIPLAGDAPSWDALTMVIPRRWGGGHTSRLDDRQIVMTEDALEIRPRGQEAKRMLSAPLGTLEMIDPDRGTFRKTARYVAGASYPLSTNVAFYLGPARFMVELETMSPLQTLVPNGQIVHTEMWSLA